VYSRILVPLDGTELGEAILPHATAIAERFGATLVLLRVSMSTAEAVRQTTPVDPITAVPTDMDVANDLVETDSETAHVYLERLCRQLLERKLSFEALLMEGDARTALRQAVKDQRIDLVTMATHGRSALGRVFQGSVAEGLLHEVNVPVLMLHAQG
jgi:nucleotide-binding universal stress UspA family protein